MRYSVRRGSRLGVRKDVYASIEDALKAAELHIAARQPSVKLEDHQTGDVYDEKGIAEIRKLIDNA